MSFRHCPRSRNKIDELVSSISTIHWYSFDPSTSGGSDALVDWLVRSPRICDFFRNLANQSVFEYLITNTIIYYINVNNVNITKYPTLFLRIIKFHVDSQDSFSLFHLFIILLAHRCNVGKSIKFYLFVFRKHYKVNTASYYWQSSNCWRFLTLQ